MQGKTKGVFEDVFVLLVIVSLGWGGYSFFFNEDETSPLNTTIAQSQPTTQPTIPPNTLSPKEFSTITEKKSIKETEKIEVKNTEEPDTNIQKDYEKVTKEQVINQNIQEEKTVLKQSVDLQVLQEFLITTKQKIQESIIVNSKNNKELEELSIRVTVLKNGSFEQLVYTGGNKDIFTNNFNNISGVFPVEINEKIKAEFPRYLRYSFKFSVKEE